MEATAWNGWGPGEAERAEGDQLTDCDGENGETDTSLSFARDCGYLTDEQYERLSGACCEIGRMLGSMLRNPKPFLITDA
jgi:four helix bundle protein